MLSSRWPDRRREVLGGTARAVAIPPAVVDMVQVADWGSRLSQLGQKFVVSQVHQGILGVWALTFARDGGEQEIIERLIWIQEF